ncbi:MULTISPECIES: phosphate signaling complex protein PhoU [Syntrophothermus]|uniref:Phosphate-specific transport system accessory protein PhoU n=1 Tax=Syntrophothermus lipocalidus (strain DSM 12680 / TGB-C1) TaxID=643648 RepID=D7CK42_SYNLT|nr:MULTISPECIES: phosphate signaling complex protein PhoU [Syntrophothermus]ADI01156.1 phosphate uptake regulator, PhoU [Syntrophothermus lipocalidus DSM 12680]NSW81825.1 phosphate signaling complex protein PhoU [Syntrophothermus sp.]
MGRDEFNRELVQLKGDVVKMATLLEELVYKAVRSMVLKDVGLAEEVITSDDIVDKMTVDIEQRCLSLIALRQPMAKDLRTIGSVLRIIVDLERIGDYAEGLAKITIKLKDQEYMKPLIDIPRMGEISREMLKKCTQAMLEEDPVMCWTLVEDEQVMDALYDQIFRELLAYMMADPKTINQATSLLLAAGHLERIGDHITNVGEMIIFAISGERVDINRMAREQRR